MAAAHAGAGAGLGEIIRAVEAVARRFGKKFALLLAVAACCTPPPAAPPSSATSNALRASRPAPAGPRTITAQKTSSASCRRAASHGRSRPTSAASRTAALVHAARFRRRAWTRRSTVCVRGRAATRPARASASARTAASVRRRIRGAARPSCEVDVVLDHAANGRLVLSLAWYSTDQEGDDVARRAASSSRGTRRQRRRRGAARARVARRGSTLCVFSSIGKVKFEVDLFAVAVFQNAHYTAFVRAKDGSDSWTSGPALGRRRRTFANVVQRCRDGPMLPYLCCSTTRSRRRLRRL